MVVLSFFFREAKMTSNKCIKCGKGFMCIVPTMNGKYLIHCTDCDLVILREDLRVAESQIGFEDRRKAVENGENRAKKEGYSLP